MANREEHDPAVVPGVGPTASGVRVRSGDWTRGAAKLAAAGLLGALAAVGIGWSLAGQGSRPVLSAPAGAQGTAAFGAGQGAGEGRVQGAGAAGEVPSAGKRVNINTAGSAELQMLPGIGPALAQRILEDREKHGAYATVEQLDRVRGIGPKTIEKLRAMATVEGEGGVGTGEGQR